MAAEEIITQTTVSLVHQRAINARGWIDAQVNQIRLEVVKFLTKFKKINIQHVFMGAYYHNCQN